MERLSHSFLAMNSELSKNIELDLKLLAKSQTIKWINKSRFTYLIPLPPIWKPSAHYI